MSVIKARFLLTSAEASAPGEAGLPWREAAEGERQSQVQEAAELNSVVGGERGGCDTKEMLSLTKGKSKPQMIPRGGKVSKGEMKWKTPTNWKLGPETEERN